MQLDYEIMAEELQMGMEDSAVWKDPMDPPGHSLRALLALMELLKHEGKSPAFFIIGDYFFIFNKKLQLNN